MCTSLRFSHFDISNEMLINNFSTVRALCSKIIG